MKNFLRATATVLSLAAGTSLHTAAKHGGGNSLNAMKRNRIVIRAAPILIGAEVLLSACAVSPQYSYGYDGYDYAPVYSSFGFFDDGGLFHHDRDHRGFGHGFAEHAGLGFHGGGFHGGGGHGAHG